MTTDNTTTPTPLTPTVRALIDLTHAQALDLIDAAIRSDRVAVSAIVSRSVDPALLAGVVAHIASVFAYRAGRPHQQVSELRDLLTADIRRQSQEHAGAGA